MKYFTEPTGRFIIKIPISWQYKNILIGYEEKSPFGFEKYDNVLGAFQISCYSKDEQPINSSVTAQKYATDNLTFVEKRMDGGGFNVHLWFAVVEDFTFMAKYVYETNVHDKKLIEHEINLVKQALASLQLLHPAKRELALEVDKYEKFMAALSASFDLHEKAIQKEASIELLIIIANQIDAYLRIALVLKQQLIDKTDSIKIELLYQGESDKPIFERAIYKLAYDKQIIKESTFIELERLYKERNKVVHRFIISDFKTKDIYKIVLDFIEVCEIVRQDLAKLEQQQFKEKVGMHGGSRNPSSPPSPEDLQMLYSQINDKHSDKEYYREIKE